MWMIFRHSNSRWIYDSLIIHERGHFCNLNLVYFFMGLVYDKNISSQAYSYRRLILTLNRPFTQVYTLKILYSYITLS